MHSCVHACLAIDTSRNTKAILLITFLSLGSFMHVVNYATCNESVYNGLKISKGAKALGKVERDALSRSIAYCLLLS